MKNAFTHSTNKNGKNHFMFLIQAMFLLFLTMPLPSAFAQTYPVQVQPTINFPSVFLSDYNDPSNLNVRVLLSDPNKTNYHIWLKVKLVSEHYTAISTTGIQLVLQHGQYYFLNDVELAQLFNASNLLITTNVPTNTDNSLPEGVYTMSFEATDATVPTVVVSNAATDFTVFSVNRYDPPMLNSPTTKQVFDLTTINQNVFFNWTPRQITFSPREQVKYRFRLIRVQPVDRNPYDAMNVTLPALIDVDGLDFPVFIYTPADLPLEEGCVYAWQVMAYEEVLSGSTIVRSSSRFKNEGLSEVFTFSIKENCAPVTPFQTPDVSKNLVALQWNFDPSHKEYELAYRPFNTSLPWTPVSTVDNLYNLDNTVIEPGVTYEYTVKAKCKNNWIDPAYGGTFTMAVPTCSAPVPVTVDNSGTDKMKLNWEAVKGATAYRFQYVNLANPTDPYTSVDLTDADLTYSIDKLTSGGYKIKVDAVCGTETAEGTPNDVAFDDNGVVGPCPIPTPFQLIATRIHADSALLSWTTSSAYSGYSITYWHRDSVNVKRTLTSTSPFVKAGYIYDDQLYVYQITFDCGNKTTTTPTGMFRIDGTSTGIVTDARTGNCFPPAVLQAEARSTTSALFEWSTVDGVDAYQLFYSVKGANQFKPFNTISTSALIKDLQDSEKYQFLVRSRCGGTYSIYSDTALVDLAGGKSNANCDSAAYFITKGQTTSNIRLCWPYAAANTGYKLTYREEAQSPADAYTQAFTDIDAFKTAHLVPTGDTLKFTVDNLKSGTAYIFKLQVLCGTDEALANYPLKVNTVADLKSSGECGKTQVCDKTNVTPLASLAPGDSIHCADYGVLVDKVTSSDAATGTYSGSGFMNMPIPGLGDLVRMSVSFKDVKINAQPNSCIYDGSINIDSINASVLPIDVRDKIKGIENQVTSAIDGAQTALAAAQSGIDQAQQAVQSSIDYFQGGDNVGSVHDGGLGEATTTQTITLPATATVNGTTATIAGATLDHLPGLVKDGTGNVFQVAPDGTVTHVGVYDPTLASDPTLDLTNGKIVYAENSTAKYDFDEWKSQYAGKTQVERKYEKIGTNYYVPAKLLLPGVMDKVNASLVGGTYDLSKIKFANGKGMVYDQTLSGTTFTINLAGGPAADGQNIYAWYVDGTTKTAIGKLLAPSYAPMQKSVVIIPVGKSVIDAAVYQKGLNDAYAKLGVTYTVTVDNTFSKNTTWDSDGDGKVQASGSKLLSNDYQGEEAGMIQAYADSKGGSDKLDANTAYFLAVYEASKLEDNLLGKMPPDEQFGFIYVGGADAVSLARTVAHEVGHGAYHLEHTFQPVYLGPDSKSTTSNLMDYGNGTDLWKYQWDIVYDPGHVWGILKKDKDAQAAIVSNVEVLYNNFKNDDGSLTFLSVAGKPLTIKEKLLSVSFVTSEDIWSKDRDFMPMGTLVSFKLETGEIYNAIGTAKGSTAFQGYADAKDVYYKDAISIQGKYKNVIAGILCIKQGKTAFTVYPTNYLDKVPGNKVVTATNQGEGTEIGDYEISGYLPDPSKAQVVYAKLEHELTMQELFFLDTIVTTDDLCGQDAVLAYKTAYYVRENPNLLRCLGDAGASLQNSLSYQFFQELKNSTPQTGTDLAAMYDLDNPDLQKERNFDIKAKETAFIQTNYFTKLLGIFQNYYALTDGINSLTVTDDDINYIIDFFDEEYYGRLCMLRNIPIDKRKLILDKHTSWTLTSSKESLMCDLIETTPDEDLDALLTYFQENKYTKLWELYEDLGGIERDRYITFISQLIDIKYQSAIPETVANSVYASFFNPINYQPEGTSYVLVCKDNQCTMENMFVSYKTGYSYDEGSGNLSFDFSVGLVVQGSKKYTFTDNPFSFVKVKFLSDYRFDQFKGGESIKAGSEAIVPALWLYYILNEQQNIQSTLVLRILLDGVALAASIATLEPGPLLFAEVVTASTDIAFSLASERIHSSGDKTAEAISDAWDVFYAAYGVGLLIKPVTSGIIGAIKYPFYSANWTAYLNGLKRSRQGLLDFASALKTLMTNIKAGTAFKTNNIMYAYLFSYYMEAKIATYYTDIDNTVACIIKNGDDVVIKAGATEMQIANVVELPQDGSLLFTDVVWYEGEYKSIVGEYTNIKFKDIDNANTIVGDVQVVQTASGQLYMVIKDFYTTLKYRGYNALATKVDALGSLKNTFLTDFYLASNTTLKALDASPSLDNLISQWKTYRSQIKDAAYIGPDDQDIPALLSTLTDQAQIDLVKKVDAVPLSQYEDEAGIASYVAAGAIHPDYPDVNIAVQFNLGGAEKGIVPQPVYTDLIKNMDPYLTGYIDYLNLIRDDYINGGQLYQQLMTIPAAKLSKLRNAGKAGSHAEVRAVSEILKALRKDNVAITDDVVSQVVIFVKNNSGKNMCRCPNCFHILNKIKVIGE
ncbi:MAG: hypothetical protein JWO58_1500 [Chitinophagaceae bacterium]|nr:hypothetical protein [Chitinophagaceae bacterium]